MPEMIFTALKALGVMLCMVLLIGLLLILNKAEGADHYSDPLQELHDTLEKLSEDDPQPNITCRWSISLETGCGHCSKCVLEKEEQ